LIQCIHLQQLELSQRALAAHERAIDISKVSLCFVCNDAVSVQKVVLVRIFSCCCASLPSCCEYLFTLLQINCILISSVYPCNAVAPPAAALPAHAPHHITSHCLLVFLLRRSLRALSSASRSAWCRSRALCRRRSCPSRPSPRPCCTPPMPPMPPRVLVSVPVLVVEQEQYPPLPAGYSLSQCSWAARPLPLLPLPSYGSCWLARLTLVQ
jgi:hypothetical protein